MELHQENSVYDLITSLCEKFSSDQDVVRKLRCRAYEILLKKRTINSPGRFKNLQGADPYTNLLAWRFTLSTKYGLEEHGLALQECADCVREYYGDDVIQFLMSLRQIPTPKDDFMDFESNFETLFRAPSVARTEYTSATQLEEEETESGFDLWEIASKTKYTGHKTWESFGYAEPDKEKPFLSELGEQQHLWVENLPSVYASSEIRGSVHIKPLLKTLPEFIKDIKYLLVGLATYSFSYADNGDFYLIPNITVEGVTPSTLKSLCQDFIFCGNCFKALNAISTPCPRTGEYKQKGYIFAELCQSIQRYLEFYRGAIFKLPNSIGLLKFDHRTTQIRTHLKSLTEIFKLGPHSVSGTMPDGVSLLNYLYQTVLNEFDRKFLLVLNAMFFPCCQVYFIRFLQPWLLDGLVNDPYEEFFIKANYKYIATRGRTYWTRSYSVREDIVPDFLVDLRMDILNCGKAMNLLKLCARSCKLCAYLMGQKPHVISCCLTPEQLKQVEQNATSYFLEVLSDCGPIINLEEIVKRKKERDPAFMNLIAKKRATTLQRIELERKKKLEEEKERKLDEMVALKEQYDSALHLKQIQDATEIDREIKLIEFNLSVEEMRDKLIEKEANAMINYYNNLFEISEKRRKHVEKHIQNLKISLDPSVPLESRSSAESFYSVEEPPRDEEEGDVFVDSLPEPEPEEPKPIHSSKSLDIINANTDRPEEPKPTLETFEMARKIKEKVLAEEMGIIVTIPSVKRETETVLDNQNLTDAQKNKLRVLNSEFGIEVKPQTTQFKKRSFSQMEINRNRVLGTHDCFYGDFNAKKVDNFNFLNKNTSGGDEPEKKMGKSVSLSLDFVKNDYPTPMSVDSTPLSDSTGSRMERVEVESIPTTAETQATDEGFDFDRAAETSTYIPVKSDFSDRLQKPVFSKRVAKEEASESVVINCLKVFLNQSVSVALTVQTKLVNSELLKYFVEDLQYLGHLSSLRDFFFLQDGEFGRNITENLFEKLYDVRFPTELINCKTLQKLVFEALEMSSKSRERAYCLSFKINKLPERFDLRDPDVLDCLSLTYNVKWPLNILLPVDTIGKYDEVFRYLLKLNRISWVLKRIAMDLKTLAKVSGKKEIYLMMSPHYRRVHQCRHVMLHFIQTLQNYFVGEVLHPSWEIFGENLGKVTNIDALYFVHTSYIKSVLFLCLLNQKSTPLKKIIEKIFVVILKFYDHLRSRSWKCEDGTYVHPNFSKLESIFNNFEEFVLYLFKVGRKVARSGYQPHLTQLLDMLDINCYYSKKKLSFVT